MKKSTARWIRRTHIFRSDEYECSACGCRADKAHATCPRCGARMKGTAYDPSWVDEAEIADMLLGD